jgi:hypothetical protein
VTTRKLASTVFAASSRTIGTGHLVPPTSPRLRPGLRHPRYRRLRLAHRYRALAVIPDAGGPQRHRVAIVTPPTGGPPPAAPTPPHVSGQLARIPTDAMVLSLSDTTHVQLGQLPAIAAGMHPYHRQG